MRAWICLLLVVGCGPAVSQVSSSPSVSSMPSMKDKPKSYRTTLRLQKDFALGRGCGSGPFQLAVELPPLHGLSRVRIYSVGPHALPIRFDVATSSFTTWIRKVDADERCAARAGEQPTIYAATAPEPAPAPMVAPRSNKKATVAPVAPPVAEPVTLIALTTPLPQDKMVLQGEMYLTDGAPRSIPDLDGNECWTLQRPPVPPLRAKLWLTAVQHLDDMGLRVEIEELSPVMGGVEFEAAVSARLSKDRAIADSRAEACRENPHVAQCFVGCSRANVKSGINVSISPGPLPPPPVERPSPRPRKDAEWIAGSWRWTGAKYEWDAGFWRVPRPVVPAASATVRVALPAPPPPPIVVAAPPPPPPVEIAPPLPPPSAVLWVPGYWVWTGAAWSWITGSWQAPPAPAARFIPPRIVVVPGRVTFDPGRWIIAPR